MPTKHEAAKAAAPEETPPATPTPTNWRFLGEHQLTYAAIPVTVQEGDVIAHDGPPAEDGRWEATDAEVTRRPDNAPEEG